MVSFAATPVTDLSTTCELWLQFVSSTGRVVMAQRIDILSDDRGLRACMDGANVAPEWREALMRAHSIATLDDFVYLVTATEWEASIRDLVQGAGSPVKDNRIALARFKSAWEAGAAALKQAMNAAPSAQDPDALLPETTLQTLQRDFDKRYNYKVEPFLDPNDALDPVSSLQGVQEEVHEHHRHQEDQVCPRPSCAQVP